jgi:hypothetical protein
LSLAALALAVGRGRGGQTWVVDMGRHYQTLALPAILITHIASRLYGSGMLQRIFLVGQCGILLASYTYHLPWLLSPGLRQQAAIVQHDLDAGVPPAVVARRYREFFWPYEGEAGIALVKDRLERLQAWRARHP